MRSVSLLARSLALAAASIAGAAESELRLRVQPLQVGRRVPEDFLGFSFEATLIGDDWQFPSKPSPMDQL